MENWKPLYVAGAAVSENQVRLATFGEGAYSAQLVREPGNNYDTNAVRVDVLDENGSTKVGYVPRWKAKELGPKMDKQEAETLLATLQIFPPDPGKGLYRAEIVEVTGRL